MLTLPAMAYSQVQPPLAMSTLAQGSASDTTLGSIPSRSVYSAIPLPELQNQRGGGAAYTALPTPQAIPSTTAPPFPASLTTLISAGSGPDFSVAFFAQLLGQSDINAQSEITRNFRDAVPLRPQNPELLAVYRDIIPTRPQNMEVSSVTNASANTVTSSLIEKTPAVVLQSAFRYTTLNPVLPQIGPKSLPMNRIMTQKSPTEAYQQTANRRVTPVEENLDAAA